MKFYSLNERPAEYRFVFQCISKFCPINVLDIGTGMTALPSLMRTCGCLVTSIDNINDYWPHGMTNRHYHVINNNIINITLKGSYDLITCVSVIEHIKEHEQAVLAMISLLKPGGYLIITCPYTDNIYINNVYSLPESSAKNCNYKFITQSFSKNEIKLWMKNNDLEIVIQEFWKYYSGYAWTIGDYLLPATLVKKEEKHQHTCILFKKCLKCIN